MTQKSQAQIALDHGDVGTAADASASLR